MASEVYAGVFAEYDLCVPSVAYTRKLSTEGFFELSSISHFVYDLASFNVLASVNPVTILTIFIKIATYVGAENLVPLFLCSVFVILVGIYLYWSSIGQLKSKLISGLFFLVPVYYNIS